MSDERVDEVFAWVVAQPGKVEKDNSRSVSEHTDKFFSDRYGLSPRATDDLTSAGVLIYKRAIGEIIVAGCPPYEAHLHAAATLSVYAFLAGAEFATRYSHEIHERQAAALSAIAEQITKEALGKED